MRTYVVLAAERRSARAEMVTPLGTVRAAGRRAARALASGLAAERGRPPSPWVAIEVVSAGACRRAWLLVALAQDGDAQRAQGNA